MASEPHDLVAAYAMDALDEHEEREFERHLASCERCREELASLREAAAGLAYGAVGPAPPPELKQRILAEAKAERPNVIPFPQRRRWAAPIAAAAALAAAFALGVGVWATARPKSSDPLAAVLAKPGAKVVALGGKGTMAWAPDGSAALALTVPRAPEGKTYEAWVIRNGTARRAGLLPGTSTLRIQLPVRKGSVVAVTLERAGGVDLPTNPPLAQTKALS
jgi:anti-sigma-K factor RskA